MVSPNFEVIAGTYEEFLLGYNFTGQSKIAQSFAAHDHSSSIRSLCTSGHYLATGAADDRIIVYDLKTRKEHCMLTHHNASLTCLQFTNNHSHLLSGSSDGVLAVVRVGNWQVEKVWEKPHKGSAILDIALHPSGKLALTLGADHTLRTWNLIKGRQAYAINLNSKSHDAKSLEKITWAADGTRFILSGGKYTEVWGTETGGILKVIEHDEKICSCIWFSENEILVGYENGQIALVDISDGTKQFYQAHAGRVKVIALYNDWIVSGSTTGEIKVWDKELQEVAKHDSGCRITCLVVVPLVKIKEEDNSEDVQVETVRNTAMSRRSVIMEIEDGDDDSVHDLPKVKNKPKVDTITFEVNKRKKEKIKSKKATSLKGIKNQEIERRKIKKDKKQKQGRQDALIEEKVKQQMENVKLMGSYGGYGRKKKEIIDAEVNKNRSPRRRKSEMPIKTEKLKDGQPKRISVFQIMEHLEERRKVVKERKEIIAQYKEEQKQKKNMKVMGPYMGCGRKRKEIINSAVSGDELPKQKRRRKAEKPVKKDTSINDRKFSLGEIRAVNAEEPKRTMEERKEKRRLRKEQRKLENMGNKRRKDL